MATTLLCDSCGCGPSLDELGRPSNAYYSLFAVTLLRRKLFASAVSASLFAYGFRAYQTGWNFSFTWAVFILACIFWYLSLYRRQVLRQYHSDLESRVLGSSMSSASYISKYARHLGYHLKPAEWNCERCKFIIRKKNKDTFQCRNAEQRHLQNYRKRASRLEKLWPECKEMAGSLLLSGPSGFALALEPIYSLPPIVLGPTLVMVQMTSILLVSNLHSDWYKNSLSSGLEMPLLSYMLQYLAVYSLRFFSFQLGLLSDPLMQSLYRFQESMYDEIWSDWRDYRLHATAASLFIAALTLGFAYWTGWHDIDSDSEPDILGGIVGATAAS